MIITFIFTSDILNTVINKIKVCGTQFVTAPYDTDSRNVSKRWREYHTKDMVIELSVVTFRYNVTGDLQTT